MTPVRVIGGRLCRVELDGDEASGRHRFRVRTVDGSLWCSGTIGGGGASLALHAYGVAPDARGRCELRHVLDTLISEAA